MECRRLHRKYGTTYYFASQLFPAEVRAQVHALYGFVRLPDEWVDNPSPTGSSPAEMLKVYRKELVEAVKSGTRPSFAVLRAFCDVVNVRDIPLEEPLSFLDAMESDLMRSEYQTYDDLRQYMRGSASSVGVMMSHILCGSVDIECLSCAKALGEAMQMTNFLRDISEDLERGRIYIPQEDLASFNVSVANLRGRECTEGFKNLMRFEIERTRNLYRTSDKGLAHLPGRSRKAVAVASLLYERILNRIEKLDYDVFRERARTSRSEKIAIATRIYFGART